MVLSTNWFWYIVSHWLGCQSASFQHDVSVHMLIKVLLVIIDTFLHFTNITLYFNLLQSISKNWLKNIYCFNLSISISVSLQSIFRKCAVIANEMLGYTIYLKNKFIALVYLFISTCDCALPFINTPRLPETCYGFSSILPIENYHCCILIF